MGFKNTAKEPYVTGDPFGLWKNAPKEWSEKTLWEVANYVNGRPFKPSDFSPVGIPVIKITELKYGISPATNYFQGEYDQKHLLEEGDLLFAWSGNPETSLDAFRWSNGKAILNQHIFRVLPKEKINKSYLFFLLKFLRSTFIRTARDKATSMGHIKLSDLKRLIAKIPSETEQEAISSILRSLEDKIALTRKMNETLEAMAMAIFKSWFVDFDPVHAKAEGRKPAGMDVATAALFPDSFQDTSLGKIPKGWKAAPLDQIVEIIGGGTPKTTKPEYWNGKIPWFSVIDAPRPSDIFVIDTQKMITRTGLDESSARILSLGTTIISARGTVGKLALAGVPMAMNQSCYGLNGKEGLGPYFTHFLLRNILSELQKRAHGSIFDTITRDTFKTVTVVLPLQSLSDRFETTVGPLLEQALANLREARTLTSTRDSLLPKLLSGEIQIVDNKNL